MILKNILVPLPSACLNNLAFYMIFGLYLLFFITITPHTKAGTPGLAVFPRKTTNLHHNFSEYSMTGLQNWIFPVKNNITLEALSSVLSWLWLSCRRSECLWSRIGISFTVQRSSNKLKNSTNQIRNMCQRFALQWQWVLRFQQRR